MTDIDYLRGNPLKLACTGVTGPGNGYHETGKIVVKRTLLCSPSCCFTSPQEVNKDGRYANISLKKTCAIGL